MFDSKEVTEREPELGRENRFLVAYDGVREAVIFYHHIYDHFCQFWSVDGDFDWLIVYHLGQLVDNDKNRIVAIALLVRGQRQSVDKVHGEVLPPIIWYRQGLQVTIGLVSDRL